MTINLSPRSAPAHWRSALTLTIVAGVCALGLVIAGVRAQAVTRHPATSQPAADAPALLEQRRDAYRRIEQIIEEKLRQGSASPSALHEAKLGRLEAELDLAENESAYARIQDAIVQELKREEARVMAAVRTGRATEVDALRAKINRLETEIEIAWEDEDDGEYHDGYSDK